MGMTVFLQSLATTTYQRATFFRLPLPSAPSSLCEDSKDGPDRPDSLVAEDGEKDDDDHEVHEATNTVKRGS
jgi:hypothetical protein